MYVKKSPNIMRCRNSDSFSESKWQQDDVDDVDDMECLDKYQASDKPCDPADVLVWYLQFSGSESWRIAEKNLIDVAA